MCRGCFCSVCCIHPESQAGTARQRLRLERQKLTVLQTRSFSLRTDSGEWPELIAISLACVLARLLPNSLMSLCASVSSSNIRRTVNTHLTGLLGRSHQFTHGKVLGQFLAVTMHSAGGYSYYCDFDLVEFYPVLHKQ